MKTLIVEDERATSTLFENQLQVWGYDVTVCDDAETALEAYQHTFYPLIILDLELPGMDGFEFCRRIRALPRKEQSMILVTTAYYNTPEDLQTALDAGADDYVVKPITMDFLRMRLTIMERQYRCRLQQTQAEEGLYQLKKAIETLQVGVTITDLHGKIVYTNPAEARLHGYEVEELLGQDLGIFAPGHLRNPLSSEQIKTMTHRVRESVNVRKEGSTFPVQLISDLVTDSEGEPVAVVTICEDITERKQAEHAYEILTEKSLQGLMLYQENCIVFLNEAFARIHGYTREDLRHLPLNQCLEKLVHPDDLALVLDYTHRREQNEAVPDHYQCQILRRDREVRWIEVYVSRMMYQGRPAFQAAILDITERKQHERALEEEKDRLKKVNTVLKSTVQDVYRFEDIIGKSPAMQEVYESIANAAASHANVVIQGESGTGKELIAWTIHYLSERKNRAFVPVNCGAVTDSLFEREFFGHRKGAFTGAHQDQQGFFDHAHGGSLFLDEVGELTAVMQVKLLRALAGGGYTPVGDHRLKHADVRIIAATNKNLEELIHQKLMREDFFFRIHVIPITLPPLRERREDIPLLIDYFLKQYSEDEAPPLLPGSVLEQLYDYDWPGNVRELQNVLQRYLTTKRLDFPRFTRTIEQPENDSTDEDIIQETLELHQAVETFEKRYIEKALTQHRWHRGKTASTLGIDPRTLYRKMKDYRLS